MRKFDGLESLVGEYDYKKVILTGCTHFNHTNIIKFERTNFATIEEHDLTIIGLINDKVESIGPGALLIHLGDVGFPDIMKRVNCKKVLIRGNHDVYPDETYLAVFDYIYKGPQYIGDRFMLSHEPRIKEDGIINIHAHLHNSVMIEQIEKKNYHNVGIHMSWNPKDGNQIYKREGYYIPTLDEFSYYFKFQPKINYKFGKEPFYNSYKWISGDNVDK